MTDSRADPDARARTADGLPGPGPIARFAGVHRGARRFFQAPKSVAAVVAAFQEPAVDVAALYLAHVWVGLPFDRPAVLLSVLVIALTFPGTERWRDTPLASLGGILASWAAVLALLAMCGYVTAGFGNYYIEVVQIWAVATPFAQWLLVLAGRAWLRRRARAEQALRRVVVIGGGELGIATARALRARTDARLEVAGWFDDRRGDRLHPQAAERHLGGLEEAARYVDKLGIREVYITLPMGSQPRTAGLLEALQRTTTSIFFVPDVFSMQVVQGRLHDMDGLPVVGICETPFTGINGLVKRASDLAIALAVLAFTLPLTVPIAAAIRIGSRGPVLVRERRSGLDGEEILVWKFRTARVRIGERRLREVGAEEAEASAFGARLRRLGLDRLPQLLNVLRGDMSIVGPRAHGMAHSDAYRAAVKGFMVRHKARPGITGWAQINGHRGETSSVEQMQQHIARDLEYLRNWSLALDLAIMARTVRLVLAGWRRSPRGAQRTRPVQRSGGEAPSASGSTPEAGAMKRISSVS